MLVPRQGPSLPPPLPNTSSSYFTLMPSPCTPLGNEVSKSTLWGRLWAVQCRSVGAATEDPLCWLAARILASPAWSFDVPLRDFTVWIQNEIRWIFPSKDNLLNFVVMDVSPLPCKKSKITLNNFLPSKLLLELKLMDFTPPDQKSPRA